MKNINKLVLPHVWLALDYLQLNVTPVSTNITLMEMNAKTVFLLVKSATDP